MVSPDMDVVTLMWGTQLGKTTAELLAFWYLMRFYPKNYLWGFPDDRLLDRWWREKFIDFMAANPSLRSLVRRVKYGSMEYVGGRLEVGLSTAPSSLTSFTATVGFIDEEDQWQLQPDSDNVRTSIESRGAMLGERFRLIEGSTPHGKAGSYIFEGFRAGSRFEWEVPCYHRRCRTMQELTMDTVEDGKLHCVKCGRPWTDAQRWDMLEDNRASWASRNVNYNPRRHSYHASALMSPVPLHVTLDRAPGDPRGFTCQVMGWPYDDEVAPPPEAHELERIFTPDEVEDPDAIILAVDVQGNRLEYMITHWDGMVPRVHTQANFPRRADPLACWRELDDLIWDIRPDFTVIDRSKFAGTDVVESVMEVLGGGGPRAADMLRFRKIRLIKGGASRSPDMITSRNAKSAQWNLNATETKLGVHRLLQLNDDGEQLMSARREGVPRNFIAQLLAERYVVRHIQGRPVAGWEKPIKSAPNESLDLEGYSLAARYELGLSYRRRPVRQDVFPIVPGA